MAEYICWSDVYHEEKHCGRVFSMNNAFLGEIVYIDNGLIYVYNEYFEEIIHIDNGLKTNVGIKLIL